MLNLRILVSRRIRVVKSLQHAYGPFDHEFDRIQFFIQPVVLRFINAFNYMVFDYYLITIVVIISVDLL